MGVGYGDYDYKGHGYFEPAEPTAKELRMDRANHMLVVIARYGRHFFLHDGKVAYFFLKRGAVYFWDEWAQGERKNKPVYTAYRGSWRFFSGGGTLRNLVEDLSAYIQGKPFRRAHPLKHLGPWPEWVCEGDLWGYGKDDMEKVRQECSAIFEGEVAV